jgi:hypothetical protein
MQQRIAITARFRRQSANSAKKSSNKVNRTNLIGVTYGFQDNPLAASHSVEYADDWRVKRVISTSGTGA